MNAVRNITDYERNLQAQVQTLTEQLELERNTVLALSEQLESVRADAARYQWLRDPLSPVEKCFYSRGDYGSGLWNMALLDEAIDAAMKAGGAA